MSVWTSTQQTILVSVSAGFTQLVLAIHFSWLYLDDVDLILSVVTDKVRDLLSGLDVPELDAKPAAARDERVPSAVPLSNQQVAYREH